MSPGNEFIRQSATRQITWDTKYRVLGLVLAEEDLVWLMLFCTTTDMVTVLTQRTHNPLYVTGTRSCKWARYIVPELPGSRSVTCNIHLRSQKDAHSTLSSSDCTKRRKQQQHNDVHGYLRYNDLEIYCCVCHLTQWSHVTTSLRQRANTSRTNPARWHLGPYPVRPVWNTIISGPSLARADLYYMRCYRLLALPFQLTEDPMILLRQ